MSVRDEDVRSPANTVHSNIEHTELASARVRIHIENFVDDGVEVHEPSILSQVVLRFAQERICLAVATVNGDFTRLCQ